MLLLTALVLSSVAEELADPNCGKELKGALLVPAPEDTTDAAVKDGAVAPVTADRLPVPELEIAKVPPAQTFCEDTEALGDEALLIDPFEFDASRPLPKVANFVLANLNTGLHVKDATCPELLEDIS